ncbi:MAG: hypothetical protein ACM3WV_03975 [Bacillota bacterium]
MNNLLKPMGIREILDNTFSIMRERFWIFQAVLSIAFLPSFLFFSAGLALFVIQAVKISGGIPFNPAESRFWQEITNLHPGIIGEMAISLLVILLLTIVSLPIGALFATYASIKVFQSGFLGKKCEVFGAFKGVSRKIWRFIGSSILISLMCMPITVLALSIMATSDILGRMISSVTYMVQFFFLLTPVVITLEDNSATDSLIRAFHLLEKHRWRILGVQVVTYLFVYWFFITIIVGLLAVPITVAILYKHVVLIVIAVLSGLVSFLAGAMALPLLYGTFTAIYYDLRVRKEGYDLMLQINPEDDDG